MQLALDFGTGYQPRGTNNPCKVPCRKCLTPGRWRHAECGTCRRDERTNRKRAYRRRPEVRALTAALTASDSNRTEPNGW